MTKTCIAPLRRARCAAAMADAPSATVEVAATLAALPSGVLDGGEIVLLAIKPSMWKPAFDSASWLFAGAFGAAAIAWTRTALPGLSLPLTIELVLLAGLARLGFAVLRWVPTWYLLTNRRVVLIEGVRSPRETGCLLIEVCGTSVDASLPERLAKLATVTFATDETGETSLYWPAVRHAEMVHTRIRRAIEAARGPQHGHA